MYTFACRLWRCLCVYIYTYIYIYICLPFFFCVGFDRVQAHGPDINTTVRRLTQTSAGDLSTSGTGIKKLCIVPPAWSNNQTDHQPRIYSIFVSMIVAIQGVIKTSNLEGARCEIVVIIIIIMMILCRIIIMIMICNDNNNDNDNK